MTSVDWDVRAQGTKVDRKGGQARSPAVSASSRRGALALNGGSPVRVEPWPTYDKGDAFIDDADVEAAVEVLRSRRYFRYDCRPHGETANGVFESKLCDYFGTRHALACASGTAAIALALLALDLPAGSPVACPAFTFAATPSAILMAGHRPVLVESDGDLHLDLADLEAKLADGLAAIVVVHMRGFASDMRAVTALARRHGVPVVEDAVPALGACLEDKPLGTWGTFGAFSTQSDKSLNTGEGGFLLSDDDEAFARAIVYSGAYEGRMGRHFPLEAPSVCDLSYPLLSLRMDEIRAALAASMLDRLPERLAAHHRNYEYVQAGLAGTPGIRLRRPVAPGAYLGEALVFRLVGASLREASWFASALRAEGIDARNLGDPLECNVRAFWNWKFLFPDQAAARARYARTARYLDESIDVPLSANLTPRDLDQVVEAVTKVLAHRAG